MGTGTQIYIVIFEYMYSCSCTYLKIVYNYFVSSFKIQHFTCTPACVHELILFLSRWSYHMFGHFVTLNGFA
jgi:hypothetical protein